MVFVGPACLKNQRGCTREDPVDRQIDIAYIVAPVANTSCFFDNSLVLFIPIIRLREDVGGEFCCLLTDLGLRCPIMVNALGVLRIFIHCHELFSAFYSVQAATFQGSATHVLTLFRSSTLGIHDWLKPMAACTAICGGGLGFWYFALLADPYLFGLPALALLLRALLLRFALFRLVRCGWLVVVLFAWQWASVE